MSSILDTLIKNKITAEDLSVEVEYLIPNFLVKNSLNLIYAKGGQGKSWLMLAICINLLKENKITSCIYLDMDNSFITLKDRNIDTIVGEYKDFNYIHRSKFDETPRIILKKLAEHAKSNSSEFNNKLFIFDSIRDFTLGRDMTSDKDIIPIMSELKDLREAGATVIFLHHTTKDSAVNLYKGATAFRDSVDVSYSLSSKRNQNILNYTLSIDKDRLPVQDCAFELDTQTMKLESENLTLVEVESKTEKIFIKEVVEYLNNLNNTGIKQSELVKDLSYIVADKTARKYLHKYAGEFWVSKKVTKENNATYYYPIIKDNLNIDKTPKVPNKPKPEW